VSAIRIVLAISGLFFATTVLSAQEKPLTPEEEKARDMRLPDLDRSALEPDKRAPTEVKEEDRNPFGLLAVPQVEEKAIQVQVETEEMKIRRVLGNMRISGVSGAEGAISVLVGSMVLTKGEMMPRLFYNQAEQLRVVDVTGNKVVLAFIEGKTQRDLSPRTIELSFDMAPRVRSLMPGELFTNAIKFDEKGAVSMPPLETSAVKSIIDGHNSTGAEALIERRRNVLGEAFGPGNDESPSTQSFP
jgi:hypothetical protein